MAKSKNHTNHNQNRKAHRNGIKAARSGPTPLKHLCPKYRRNLKASRAGSMAGSCSSSSGSDVFGYFGFEEIVTVALAEVRRAAADLDRRVWMALYSAELLDLALQDSRPPPQWLSVEDVAKLLACASGTVAIPVNAVLTQATTLEAAVVWAVKNGILPLQPIVDLAASNIRNSREHAYILKTLVKVFNLPEPPALIRQQIDGFIHFLARDQKLDLVSVAELFVGSPRHLLAFYNSLYLPIWNQPTSSLQAELWSLYMTPALKSQCMPPSLSSVSTRPLLFARKTFEEAQRSGDEPEIPAVVAGFVREVLGQSADSRESLGVNPILVDSVDQLQSLLANVEPELICVDCEWPATSSEGRGDRNEVQQAPVSLMQVAYTWLDKNVILLIDLETLKNEAAQIKPALLKLLTSSIVVGVAFLSADLARLRKYFADPSLAIPRYLELHKIVTHFAAQRPERIAGPSGIGLERCFQAFVPGAQLPKQYAFSNWTRRPLLNREAWYAASDVIIPLFVCKMVAAELGQEALVQAVEERTPQKPARRSSFDAAAELATRRELWQKFKAGGAAAAAAAAVVVTEVVGPPDPVRPLLTNWASLCATLRLYGVACELWQETAKGEGPPCSAPAASELACEGATFLLKREMRGPSAAFWGEKRVASVVELNRQGPALPHAAARQALALLIRKGVVLRRRSGSASRVCPLCGAVALGAGAAAGWVACSACQFAASAAHVAFLRFRLNEHVEELVGLISE